LGSVWATTAEHSKKRTRRVRMRNSEGKRFKRSVLHKLKLQSNASIGAVEERAELRGVDIVLHVARVPVVRDVEERHARAAFVFLAAKRNRESLGHEQIQRHQLRKTAAVITWTNEVLLLVD